MQGGGAVNVDFWAVIIPVAVLGLLVFVTRSTSRSRRGTIAGRGMLEVIVAGVTRIEAMEMRAKLGDAGIRTSMVQRRNGDTDVLVFRDDLATALVVLSS